MAARVNERLENIGARRMHTVMTTLLEEVLYELPDRGKDAVPVNAEMVRERLRSIRENEDLRTYILQEFPYTGTPPMGVPGGQAHGNGPL
jgi:ATP-dependent HslUV protease ATP-binding subunit HslU